MSDTQSQGTFTTSRSRSFVSCWAMRSLVLFSSLLAVTLTGLFLPERARADSGPPVHVVLEGDVDPGMTAVALRALAEAEQTHAVALILEINTFGGRVDAAVEIRDALLETKIPTTCYVNRRAISAGALICLAADTINMAPGSTIGAATPYRADSSGEPVEVTAKMVSYMREEFAATSEAKSRDPRLAEAMVDGAIEIEGLSTVGTPLTLTTGEALSLGLAERSSVSLDQLLEDLGFGGVEPLRIKKSWAENLAGILTHPLVTMVLLVLAGMGLFVEMKAPGLGVPGAVGVTALSLFLASHHVAHLAGWEDALLILLGLILIALEVFVIPGVGVAGLVGVLCLGAGVMLSMIGRNFGAAINAGTVSTALVVLSGTMIVMIALMALTLRYLPDSALLRGTLVLSGGLPLDDNSEPARKLASFIGAQGIAFTTLRPSGQVDIEGERHDALSEGEVIEQHTDIEVTAIRGASLVVRKMGRQAAGSLSQEEVS